MKSPFHLSIDLGAGSGRVFLVAFDEDNVILLEVHRFTYPPRVTEGRLRWDFQKIFAEIRTGLRAASDKAASLGRTVETIGVDSWAVDYGLLNASGQLISDPVCYRDAGNAQGMSEVLALISAQTIFERTGIQFQPFNTIFQLRAGRSSANAASLILLLPDLINYFLTGIAAAEFTNATTTQLLNIESRSWDDELITAAGVPRAIFPEIVEAGAVLGPLLPEIAASSRLGEAIVVAVATHDTASAVVGAPLLAGEAYISSGTWSLVGLELARPVVHPQVLLNNFTNEGGTYGSTRFLKNVMGLWILESCRREWTARGIDTTHGELIATASQHHGEIGLIFPDDPRFLNPDNMCDAIRDQMSETGERFFAEPAAIARSVFDSLAFRYASVVDAASEITAEEVTGIQVLGGGGRNTYLNQMTADASGLPVRSGLFEATVIGNASVQAIASGEFASIADARSSVSASTKFTNFEPAPAAATDQKLARYRQVERHFAAASAEAFVS